MPTGLLDFSGSTYIALLFATLNNPNKQAHLYILNGASLKNDTRIFEHTKGLTTPNDFDVIIRLRSKYYQTIESLLKDPEVKEEAAKNGFVLSNPANIALIKERLYKPIAIFPAHTHQKIKDQDGSFVCTIDHHKAQKDSGIPSPQSLSDKEFLKHILHISIEDTSTLKQEIDTLGLVLRTIDSSLVATIAQTKEYAASI